MYFHTYLTSLSLCFGYVLSLNNALLLDRANGAPATPARTLRAAKRNDALGRRDVKGCLRYDHELHYVDADTMHSAAPFGARVGVDFKLPTLLLEEIEHHAKTINCHPDRILLRFESLEAFTHAQTEFLSAGKFNLITSHDGCNEIGARDPHLVTDTIAYPEDLTIILFTSRVTWKHAFDSLTVDFGPSDLKLQPRQHAKLQPRQATASTDSAAATNSLAYPPAPSSTATSVNVTSDFSPAPLINQTILPPDVSLGPLSVGGLIGPQIPGGLNVKCKNCSFYGNVNLFAGSLSMGPFTSSNTTQGVVNSTEAIVDYIDDGFIEFRTNGIGAHIELDNMVAASPQLIDWTIPLPTIPITPFQIPGIAAIGPQFEPVIKFGVQVDANFTFGTGFDVTIPNNSSIRLNLAERNGSTQQGFDNTNISLLPFEASTPSVSLTLTTAFQPRLLLAISFLSGYAIAGAGFFLNSPMLTSIFTPVTNGNYQCEPANSSTGSGNTYDTMVHIDNSVELGVGVIAQAKYGLKGSTKLQDEKEYEIASKTFPLPTGCFAFDAKSSTYGIPQATGTGITKTSSNSSVPASGTGNPGSTSGSNSLTFTGDGALWNRGRLGMLVGALSTVGALFVLV